MIIIYYVPLGGSLDEMKSLYRAQEEKRHPGKFLQHVDDRMNKVRTVLEKNTTFRDLIRNAEDGARIIVDSLDAMKMCNKAFVDLYEERKAGNLSVRLLKENFLLDPKEQATDAFLHAIRSTHAQKSRLRKLPSIPEVHGQKAVEDMRQARREGIPLREIAAKFGIAISCAHRYTKGVRVSPVMKAAPDKAKEVFDLAKLGRVATTPGERLEQLVELFLSGQRKLTTAKLYRTHLETYRAFAADILGSPADSLAKFTLEAAVAFKQHRTDLGKQPATVASELKAIRAFLKFCVDEEEIPKNPLQRLKIPKIERKVQTDPLTREETSRVIAAAKQMLEEAAPLNLNERWKAHRDLLAVYLLAGVGMRHSGLLSLRKCDFSVTRRGSSLAIQSKANADRYTVGISKVVAEALDDYIERYLVGDPPESYIFHSSLDVKDKPIDLSTSSRRLTAVFDRAGITPVASGGRHRRAHSLRVSWAKFAYDGGSDIRKIQHKMNHSDVEQTYAYLKLDDTEVDTYWLTPLNISFTSDGGVRL